MGRIRRGGYVFIWWVGDHAPRICTSTSMATLLLRWDLEAWAAIGGRPSRHLLKVLAELREEGSL